MPDNPQTQTGGQTTGGDSSQSFASSPQTVPSAQQRPAQQTAPAAGQSPSSPPAYRGEENVADMQRFQLQQAVEKARLEERAKLHEQISGLMVQNQQFEKQLEDLRRQTEAQATELTAFREAADSQGKIDIQKAIEQATSAVSKRVQATYEQSIAKLQQDLQQERTLRQQLFAQSLKQRMIEEAGGASALIPELVTGTTEEEIRASIENSKAIYQRTLAQINSGLINPVAPQQPMKPMVGYGSAGTGAASLAGTPQPMSGIPPTGASQQSVPPMGSSQTEGSGAVRTMSMDEYRTNREALKHQAAARYSAPPV